ncbi:MAG TPA: DMT family transporter [Jatrophihabitantaceae bacterium]
MVYLVGLAAALCLGVGYVLQQRAAALTPLEEVLHWRLLLDLLHKPMWLWGVGAMVVGQLLGGLALQLASVALVEPLLSANLLFAFVIAAVLSDRRVRWHEVGGAVLLSMALAAFLVVGDPRSSDDPEPSRGWSIVALALVAAAVVILVVVAKKQQFIAKAVLLSTGAGLLYGLQDAATRQSLLRIDHNGIARVVTSPWAYLVVAAAVTGLLLAQSAFKLGSLAHSLPPLTAAEPLVGIALGVGLLADKVDVTPGRLAVEAACGAGVILGVYLIGTSRTLNRPHRGRRPRPDAAPGGP